jgi:cyclopropane-fatty-acyl-phospholipid synthase
MSHESLEPGRTVIYNIPTLFSDSLRSVEFSQFFRDYRGARFLVRTRDGWSWPSPAPHSPEFVAIFRSRADLDAVIGDRGEAQLSRIFLEGALEIQGNIFALLTLAEYTQLHSDSLSTGLVHTLTHFATQLPRKLLRGLANTAPQNWRCLPCPLNLPLDFFEPWLGPQLAHLFACFGSSSMNFDAAQRHALEHACATLELDSGDRLLEVGCGWGCLLLHAAWSCGADALGLPSSPAQIEAARARVLAGGLMGRCRVDERNLRSTPYAPGSFDKIASLGIFGQVASSDLGKYLACLQRMLAPGGLALLDRLTPSRDSASHLRSVHPGLPSEPLSKDLTLAESSGWELVGLESLRRDCENTLRVWIDRLRQAQARATSDNFQTGYRAWLLYLVEIATSLHAGELQVHRMLLRRPQQPSAAVS